MKEAGYDYKAFGLSPWENQVAIYWDEKSMLRNNQENGMGLWWASILPS